VDYDEGRSDDRVCEDLSCGAWGGRGRVSAACGRVCQGGFVGVLDLCCISFYFVVCLLWTCVFNLPEGHWKIYLRYGRPS